MKKLIFVLAAIIVSVCVATVYASAQNGKAAIGVRLTPDGGGFTGKFFTGRNLAIEAQLNAGGLNGGEGESFTAVGLVEYHFYFPDPSWQMYFGGGMHLGVWDHDGRSYWRGDRYYNDDNAEGIFGLDAIAGAAYKFKRIPLSLSVDLKPAVNLLSEPAFFNHNLLGFSARFHIQ